MSTELTQDVSEQDAARFGLTGATAGYTTRIRISIDKVWTTPTEGSASAPGPTAATNHRMSQQDKQCRQSWLAASTAGISA